MVFSTIIFLLRFLPITLALYYLAPPKLKNTVLFLCSLVFYCWGEVRFFPVMLALILINYLCGLGLERFEQNKTARLILLLIALAGSLGMLFYFKYANFVLSSINAIFGTGFAPIQGISVLPLGISFYTFQTLSYTIDVYRRDVKTEHNIIDFGAYVVMFPQLIAGPIVKYRDVSDRLHVYKGRCELKQIEDGMTLFTFGLAKKVLLADAIGALWTDIIGVADSPSVSFVGLANASTPLVWLGVIAYSLQLYFDFSGYSLMGIGMGKMLGFDFPQNFNYPYISASITEFWRRWHMTLSGWFREYVYIPSAATARASSDRSSTCSSSNCSPASGTARTGTSSAGACTISCCWLWKSSSSCPTSKRAGSGPISTPFSSWSWAGPCSWATTQAWSSACCSASFSSLPAA